jgi:5'-deoxynucleotidase YfbR-like HD superfamily hydrolase
VVDPLRLDPAQIKLYDIAFSLSMQCRFTGHCSSFYSVAEHSLRVSSLLRLEMDRPDAALWGLLHDAAEAYFGDLARPLKANTHMGHEFDRLEKRALRPIAKKFGLCWPMPECVRRADAIMLAVELRDLIGFRQELRSAKDQAIADSLRIGQTMDHEQARQKFIAEFNRLVRMPL